MSNVIQFPTQSATYTWGQIRKMGKAKVTAILAQKGIKFNSKAHYMTLCSLLFKSQNDKPQIQESTETVDMLDWKIKGLTKKIEKAKKGSSQSLFHTMERAKLRVQKWEKEFDQYRHYFE